MWSKPARFLPGLKRCGMSHRQDAISLRMSVEDIKIYRAVIYSSKVYASVSLVQGKDSKPPFLVTRPGSKI
ncbi:MULTISPECIES: hypothetical protein [unclassified Microcoleus]|uniref:hypothetical protein n=1 Tax=unclassified Microcoleus TaxID=2642155 RepID=UPI002FD6F1A2